MGKEEMRAGANLYSGVLSSFGGLVWHGLSSFFCNTFWFATPYKELARVDLYGASFVFVDKVDTLNFLEPCLYNHKILIPTPERSIVLYQRDEAIVEQDDDS